jgi:DNA-binding MarR family transcriptional regulator
MIGQGYDPPVTTVRPDLGALLHRLARRVIDAEVPVLRGHGLEMWDYVVLGGLEHSAAPTQAQLASAVGRDQTRLIPILDRLESRGLLNRVADHRDRRNRVVSLTEAGSARREACRASVRALEDDLRADLAPDQRATLLTTLEELDAANRATPVAHGRLSE